MVLKVLQYILTYYYIVKGYILIKFNKLQKNKVYYLYKEPLMYIEKQTFRRSNRIIDYGYFAYSKLGEIINIPYLLIGQLKNEKDNERNISS